MRRSLAVQIVLLTLAALGLACGVMFFVKPGLVTEMLRAGTNASGASIVGSIDSKVITILNGGEVLLAALLAGALAWKAAHRADAAALALFLGLWAVPLPFLPLVGVPAYMVAALNTAVLWGMTGAFLRFAALFPRPLSEADVREARGLAHPGRLRRGLARVGHWVAAPVRWPVRGLLALARRPAGPGFTLRAGVAAVLLRPRVVWIVTALGCVGGVATHLRGLNGIETLLLLAATLAFLQGIGYLLASFRLTRPEERRSLLWVVQGFYAGTWVLFLSFGVYVWLLIREIVRTHGQLSVPASALLFLYCGAILATFLVLAGLALAIFYTGSFEPSLALRKTTVYGVLTIAGGFLFAVLEETLSNVFQNWLHLSSGLGAGVAGAAVAVTIGSVKDRVARTVERRLPSMARVQGAASVQPEAGAPALSR